MTPYLWALLSLVVAVAAGLLGYDRGRRSALEEFYAIGERPLQPSWLVCPSEPSTIAFENVHFENARQPIEIRKASDGHNEIVLRDMTCNGSEVEQ